jgi:AcrR family transcriptional regulator
MTGQGSRQSPTGGGGLRAKRRSAVRARITECALGLFFERGYDATTVDDIVAAGRTSRSTFFRYFGTKDDVVLSLLDEIGDDYVARYRVMLGDHEPAVALPRAVMGSVRKAAEDPGMYELMKLSIDTPTLRSRLQSKIEDWRLELQHITAEHLGSGPGDIVPAVLTHLVVGASSAAFTVWLETGGTPDVIELLDQALDYARRGYGEYGGDVREPAPGGGGEAR